MKMYTIGFAGKNAEKFFALLMHNGIERIVDIRLSNVSQLAGFTKKDDLKYFLHEIAGIDYVYLPVFAPQKDMMDGYRKSKNWKQFEKEFKSLLKKRNPVKEVDTSLFSEKVCCLLCSEPDAHGCHRSLVAEYLSKNIKGSVQIIHL